MVFRISLAPASQISLIKDGDFPTAGGWTRLQGQENVYEGFLSISSLGSNKRCLEDLVFLDEMWK